MSYENGLNGSESIVRGKLESRGFTVLRNGWPDFLCVDRNGIFGVEVKSGADKCSEAQLRMHAALQSAGIPTYVVKNLNVSDELDPGPRQLMVTPVEMVRLRKKFDTASRRINDNVVRLLDELKALKLEMDNAEIILAPSHISMSRIESETTVARRTVRSLARDDEATPEEKVVASNNLDAALELEDVAQKAVYAASKNELSDEAAKVLDLGIWHAPRYYNGHATSEEIERSIATAPKQYQSFPDLDT